MSRTDRGAAICATATSRSRHRSAARPRGGRSQADKEPRTKNRGQRTADKEPRTKNSGHLTSSFRRLDVPRARIPCCAPNQVRRNGRSRMGMPRNRVSRRLVVASLAAAPSILRARALLAAPAPAPFVLAYHVTISPAWFDPSTAPPQITPFGVLYALHDALVRAYPGTKMGPALAESWQESEDGLTYEFKLRPNLTFHNGDPITAEDVKFSFNRYKGASATELKERVAQVEIVNDRTVRFRLKEVWPDFMMLYGSTATAAG